ncbi:MAG: hypothetical protein LBF92_05485 [Synergistaceae bacterium]|nr:hypothetical protein [Synergistaceae bacterium]
MPSNLYSQVSHNMLGRVLHDTAPGTVETASAARLHFGFLDVSGSLGRKFGSVGLSISAPRIRVRARFADELSVRGSDADAIRSALKYAHMFYGRPEISEVTAGQPKAVIFLDETIPPHRGYGSGTQLALCVASSLCRLYGIPCSPAWAALLTGRGRRSGIGIESFGRGGFIVDAGTGPGAANAPLTLFRADFPAAWRAILVLPPGVGEGLNGHGEDGAFADMPPPDPASAREICHIVMMRLLPAVLEEDLPAFGEGLARIQEITGEAFAHAQSGSFASPMAEGIFKKMRELGASGMGQSSWGPLIYGFAHGQANADAIASALAKYYAGSRALSGDKLYTDVVSGRNAGAVITKRPI